MHSSESDRLRLQMARIRSELTEDVGEVVEQAKELTDWHLFVKRHPWLCVGSAAAIGFLLVPPRPKAVPAAAPAMATAAMGNGVAGGPPSSGSKPTSVLHPLISMVAGAVVRSALALAADQLQSVLVASPACRGEERQARSS